MRIITLHNASEGKPTTGHLFNGRGDRAACGVRVNWIAETNRIDSADVHLCGNCQKVIEAKGSTMWWRYAA